MRPLEAIKRVPAYAALRRRFGFVIGAVRRSPPFKKRLVAAYLSRHTPAKLHIGCGDNRLPGWLNTEFELGPARGVLFLDATAPFPIPSDSFDFIFAEHMIEHVPVAGAINMLEECHRILKPGGRIRISTPPLEFLLELMVRPTAEHLRYADYHYSEYSNDDPLKVPAAILNDYHRKWGHQFIYDRPSLTMLLQRSGFGGIEECALNQSRHPHLKGIENESRLPDGLLELVTMTFEAKKPASGGSLAGLSG